MRQTICTSRFKKEALFLLRLIDQLRLHTSFLLPLLFFSSLICVQTVRSTNTNSPHLSLSPQLPPVVLPHMRHPTHAHSLASLQHLAAMVGEGRALPLCHMIPSPIAISRLYSLSPHSRFIWKLIGDTFYLKYY